MSAPGTGDAGRALAAARDGDLSGEQLLEILAGQDVWVPLPGGTGEPGNGSAALPVMLIDGGKYVPVYTSAEEFSRGAGDVPYMVSPLRGLARELPPELGIAVNPGGAVGLPVRPAGVDALRGPRSTAPQGDKVRLGQPEIPPAELLSALKQSFARLPELRSARSAWAQFEGKPPGVFLGVLLEPDSEAARHSVLAAVANARGQVPDADPVDCVFDFTPGNSVTRWLTSNGELLYERGTGSYG
jgi:hypothetical protein